MQIFVIPQPLFLLILHLKVLLLQQLCLTSVARLPPGSSLRQPVLLLLVRWVGCDFDPLLEGDAVVGNIHRRKGRVWWLRLLEGFWEIEATWNAGYSINWLIICLSHPAAERHITEAGKPLLLLVLSLTLFLLAPPIDPPADPPRSLRLLTGSSRIHPWIMIHVATLLLLHLFLGMTSLTATLYIAGIVWRRILANFLCAGLRILRGRSKWRRMLVTHEIDLVRWKWLDEMEIIIVNRIYLSLN